MNVVLAIAFMTVMGWFLCGALEPALPRQVQLGSAFLVGAGTAAICLWILSILHVPWSPLSFCTLVVPIIGGGFYWRHRRRISSERVERDARTPWSLLFDVLTIAVLAGYAIYATIASPWEWDFWSIWGLKGRVFWAAHSIDWTFLLDREHDFAHLDYPLLFPLTFDVTAMFGGGWNDRWLGILYVAFASSTLLVIRDLVGEEHGPEAGAVTTLALTGCCCSVWIGLAEAPMLAYSSCGLLLIRRSLRLSNSISSIGAILITFAALTKNEGLSLLLATLIGVSLFRRDGRPIKSSALLVPIGAALAWLLTRRTMHLQASDFDVRGLRTTLADLPSFLSTVVSVNPQHPILWILFAAALVFGGVKFFERERLLITTILLQVLVFCSAYAFSALEPGWHVRNSWPRLSSQLEPLIGVVIASFLIRCFFNHQAESKG